MSRRQILALAAGLLLSVAARADIAVVVNRDSGTASLTQRDVVNIFMGRYRKLPSGQTALPVDQEAAKARFYRTLVDKDLAEINAYWARLLFSGQTTPPRQVNAHADALRFVRNNQGAIGYVDSQNVPDDVRVVLTLPEPAQ